jgi:hypothetical protein
MEVAIMIRTLRTSALVLALLPGAALAGETGQVWKSPTCGCCKSWVTHMQSKGFDLKVSDVASDELNEIKAAHGITAKVASCHTAIISGYTIEGHVPAEMVTKLMAEKPDAVGLAVPGMPANSPGMETNGPGDAYDVLLIKKDGTSEVYAHYPAAAPTP